MTAIERVRRAQRILGTAAIIQAFGWGIATVFGALALMSFGSLIVPALKSNQSSHLAIADALGAIVTLSLLWRARHFSSRNRVALWIEEREPTLQYALVTAMEHSRSPFAAGLDATIEKANVGKLAVVPSGRGVSRANASCSFSRAWTFATSLSFRRASSIAMSNLARNSSRSCAGRSCRF